MVVRTVRCLALVLIAAACGRGTPSDPASSSGSPTSTATPVASPPTTTTTRAFWSLVGNTRIDVSERERASFEARLRRLPEVSTHPGKRPWSRDEVLDRLDALAAQGDGSLRAMGEYAHRRPDEPIEASDPAFAMGGGTEVGLGTFNDGAMLVLAGRVRALAEPLAQASDVAGIVALYQDIATMPLPVYSNSGGATDGRSERERLARELEAAAGATWNATAKQRETIRFVDNRDAQRAPSKPLSAPSGIPGACINCPPTGCPAFCSKLVR